MAHKIEDLRDHLFATLAALRDPDKPMEIERAKAIADVAKVVVDSAKVEVEHMKIAGGDGSGFIPLEEKKPDQSGGPGQPRLVKGRDTR
jgi:hypothetical protein